jgi:hypothetical protein
MVIELIAPLSQMTIEAVVEKNNVVVVVEAEGIGRKSLGKYFSQSNAHNFKGANNLSITRDLQFLQTRKFRWREILSSS